MADLSVVSGDSAPQPTESIEKIEDLYGDGMSFDLSYIERRLADLDANITALSAQAGCYFIRVKAHLEHGEWVDWLEHIGSDRYRVAECMWLARAHVQESGRNFLSKVGKTKSKALLFRGISEEEMKEAIQTDLFHNTPLDEIETMTAREAQSLVRQYKAERDRAQETLATERAAQSAPASDDDAPQQPTEALVRLVRVMAECERELMEWAEDGGFIIDQDHAGVFGLSDTIEQKGHSIRSILSSANVRQDSEYDY